ncbi:MAG: hypothetical protein GX155_01690 [Smithella sp.]|nr:hypothetical protein [Smithella sp.]
MTDAGDELLPTASTPGPLERATPAGVGEKRKASLDYKLRAMNHEL